MTFGSVLRGRAAVLRAPHVAMHVTRRLGAVSMPWRCCGDGCSRVARCCDAMRGADFRRRLHSRAFAELHSEARAPHVAPHVARRPGAMSMPWRCCGDDY